MYTSYAWVTNTRRIPIDFYLEPYGSNGVIPPGKSFYVWSQAPEDDFIAIEVGEESITLFVPNQAVAKVFYEEILVIDHDTPFPSVPEDWSVQRFFNSVGMPRQEEFKEDKDEDGEDLI